MDYVTATTAPELNVLGGKDPLSERQMEQGPHLIYIYGAAYQTRTIISESCEYIYKYIIVLCSASIPYEVYLA